MKIYTKTGDGGDTSLVGGARVRKDDARVEAYGTVDELSAHVSLLRDMLDDNDLRDDLMQISRDLMRLGGALAGGARMPAEAVECLEKRIDYIYIGIPPLKTFIIPGGDPRISQANVCRTVCRRAERRIIEARTIDENVLRYINRLSDFLFIFGREVAKRLKIEEILAN